MRVNVTFEPAGLTVEVEPGTRVIDAAIRAGLIIPAPCGGRGVCGRCAVRVKEGSLGAPSDAEAEGLRWAPEGIRLACLATIEEAVVLSLPSTENVPMGGMAGPAVKSSVPVAAVDVGTTTVAAMVADASTGQELSRFRVVNRQAVFGSDVLSRLSVAQEGGATALQDAVITSVVEALDGACSAAGVTRDRVARVVLAGNTTMCALLAGADVSGLAVAPFEAPVALRSPAAIAHLVRDIAPSADVLLVPVAVSFVGGDIVAGLMAAGFACGQQDAAYVDVGTNAEIAVCGGDHLTVTSAAAGPAFEGFGIAYGSMAVPGAVERVAYIDGQLDITVIGHKPPEGICGSGLMSVIALLRRSGHVDSGGRMDPGGPMSSRFSTQRGVLAFGLGPSGGPPYLLQTDVRAFQGAKAAVAAALLGAARATGWGPGSSARLVVAGEFGAAANADDLRALGVLPSDIADLIVIPDAALAGAAMIALDSDLLTDAISISAHAQHLELARDEGFREDFLKATEIAPYTLVDGFS